jgi:uncharacterized protein (DUF305 family)
VAVRLPPEILVKRVLAIALLPLTALVLAAGCGSSSDHNSQDVSFAQDMVPHHQQAVTMADLAVAQAASPRVVDLANRIKSSQTGEISLMNGWLASWGKKATDHSGDMAGMAGMASMKGMVSETDLNALRAASGQEFDRQFVQRMTAHHQGALEMAKTELDKGKFKAAKSLAAEITSGQEKEIAEMAAIQASLRA